MVNRGFLHVMNDLLGFWLFPRWRSLDHCQIDGHVLFGCDLQLCKERLRNQEVFCMGFLTDIKSCLRGALMETGICTRNFNAHKLSKHHRVISLLNYFHYHHHTTIYPKRPPNDILLEWKLRDCTSYALHGVYDVPTFQRILSRHFPIYHTLKLIGSYLLAFFQMSSKKRGERPSGRWSTGPQLHQSC